MGVNKHFFLLVEQLVIQSRRDKLMYLNEADNQNLPMFKRFFNQQALVRQSLFHAAEVCLSDYNLDIDQLLLKRPDIRQFMMTSVRREKKNSFKKCLIRDLELKQLLEELIQKDPLDKNIEVYKNFLLKIEASIKENELCSLKLEAKELI